MADLVKVSVRDGVATLVMSRPEARNALSSALVAEMTGALDDLDRDDTVRVVLVTGEGRDFAAGADVHEMICMNVQDAVAKDFAGCCTRLGEFRKPVVAAVAGYALGGGCELVEMCDVVIAAEDARFGHPEIALGTMSGAGGTQRLPRLVGRHVALDLLLTGRHLTAAEARMVGLVSRVVPREDLMKEAEAVARTIASFPPMAVRAIKEAVGRTESLPLQDGLALERRMFHLTFASDERRDRMEAFASRRQ
ncbi:enoyl-CoA hydratase-related protein [Enterovirga sp. CN4-39]|uniref:enoyl-CoA hydratase-related protein n=1 Tax=Enterovirga sp. CN4-39 TaxID=3400910 RepID=UPI003C07F305